MEKNTLVAYFSCTGTTKGVAERLAETAGADLFEIRPQVPYTSADLSWTDSKSRSTMEMHDPTSRPEVAETLSDMADYEVIFVGFPIWFYVAPTIINTFLESYDLSGKTIIPFATSGSSGMGSTTAVLKKSCSGEIKEGKRLNISISKNELGRWVESLDL